MNTEGRGYSVDVQPVASMTDEQKAARESPPLAFVVDLSELEAYPNAALLQIRCRTCRQFFYCDFEERDCPRCVERREQP